MLNYGNIPERILAKFYVDLETGCWIWTASRTKGYGRVSYQGRPIMAHRIIYSLSKGSIGNGLQLDHICRNPPCVNPTHLEPVTSRENTLRGVGPSAVNSRKTHCPQGHLLVKGTLRKGGKTRWRRCRECHNLWEIKRQEARLQESRELREELQTAQERIRELESELQAIREGRAA